MTTTFKNALVENGYKENQWPTSSADMVKKINEDKYFLVWSDDTLNSISIHLSCKGGERAFMVKGTTQKTIDTMIKKAEKELLQLI